jgi:peptidoglycan hydrolase CwlO-like protein
LDRQISDLGKASEEAQGAIETTAAELKSLADDIKALDKVVAEATEVGSTSMWRWKVL